MRLIKSALLPALVATVALALAAPGFAAASGWTKEGVPLEQAVEASFTKGGLPLEESVPVSLAGKIKFSSGFLGSQDCTLNASGTFGTNGAGQITEAAVSTDCKMGGAVAACSVTGATAHNLPWSINTGGGIMATGVNITFKYTGGFCPTAEDKVYGGFFIKPDNTDAISTLTPSGTVQGESSLGKAAKTVSGSLSVAPSGQYGIGQVGVVKLSGGSVRISNAQGSLECTSLSATIALKPGTEGTVRSFGPSGALECGNGGSLAACTITAMTPKNLPWPIVDEGTKIKVSNVAFKWDVKGGFCGYPYFEVTGTLNWTPDKAGAISSVSQSGELKTQYFGGTFSGNPFSWSPAGVFGL